MSITTLPIKYQIYYTQVSELCFVSKAKNQPVVASTEFWRETKHLTRLVPLHPGIYNIRVLRSLQASSPKERTQQFRLEIQSNTVFLRPFRLLPVSPAHQDGSKYNTNYVSGKQSTILCYFRHISPAIFH